MTSSYKAILLAFLVAGCTQEPPAPAEPAPAPEPATAPVAAPAEAAKPAEDVLVPSPAQVQAALKEAGIDAKVEELVKKGPISVQADNKDEVAVRVGVLLAHLVLTARQAPKADTLARLASAKEGFHLLGAGQDVGKTIDDLTGRLQNDAINSDDLVAELDELARVLVPEVSYEAGERAVPLIQAGGWLAGSHFVSGAIVASGKTESADKLLKHPQVVEYFLKYVESQGADKAAPMVITKLETSLETLDGVAKKQTLGTDDVQAVHSTTGDVLALL
jgi:hypothetical protein